MCMHVNNVHACEQRICKWIYAYMKMHSRFRILQSYILCICTCTMTIHTQTTHWYRVFWSSLRRSKTITKTCVVKYQIRTYIYRTVLGPTIGAYFGGKFAHTYSLHQCHNASHAQNVLHIHGNSNKCTHKCTHFISQQLRLVANSGLRTAYECRRFCISSHGKVDTAWQPPVCIDTVCLMQGLSIRWYDTVNTVVKRSIQIIDATRTVTRYLPYFTVSSNPGLMVQHVCVWFLHIWSILMCLFGANFGPRDAAMISCIDNVINTWAVTRLSTGSACFAILSFSIQICRMRIQDSLMRIQMHLQDKCWKLYAAMTPLTCECMAYVLTESQCFDCAQCSHSKCPSLTPRKEDEPLSLT